MGELESGGREPGVKGDGGCGHDESKQGLTVACGCVCDGMRVCMWYVWQRTPRSSMLHISTTTPTPQVCHTGYPTVCSGAAQVLPKPFDPLPRRTSSAPACDFSDTCPRHLPRAPCIQVHINNTSNTPGIISRMLRSSSSPCSASSPRALSLALSCYSPRSCEPSAPAFRSRPLVAVFFTHLHPRASCSWHSMQSFAASRYVAVA